VDIIVNSTANDMSLSSGKVAAALLNAAGPGLQKECDAVKPLPPGDIVMTNGYRLNCADVLHVNCPSWDSDSTEKVSCYFISDPRHYFAFKIYKIFFQLFTELLNKVHLYKCTTLLFSLAESFV